MTAVEPDPKNRRKLVQKMEAFAPGFCDDPRFTLVEGGVSSSDGEEWFDNAAGRNSSLSENGKLKVPVYSVDSLTPRKAVHPHQDGRRRCRGRSPFRR